MASHHVRRRAVRPKFEHHPLSSANPIPTSVMFPPSMNMFSNYMGIIIFLALIEAILKGFALWRAARMNKLPWFIALLIINTAGIFPLIFLLVTKDEYRKLQEKQDMEVMKGMQKQ